ncbi:hypothetical protein HDU87_007505 [Geranomyces variabilis]|uniref:Uncharacterized protein n=1 Tax=Geranomyces variabilis TaxID=109894 RepID=A0AAD5TPH2_9FUNG|nr:hypothetical protein HDU87_007505 [Geranomyces variabilis]
MPSPSPSPSPPHSHADVHDVDDIPPLPPPAFRPSPSQPTPQQRQDHGGNRFSTKNLRYIRIAPPTAVSPGVALQLILHVRKQHLMWFTPDHFDDIIKALERLLPAKLTRELTEKREQGLADVYRQDDFQMAFYLRPNEIRHAVLEKDVASTSYTSLQLHPQTLMVVAEPHHPADRSAPPPDFQGFNYKASIQPEDFLGPESELPVPVAQAVKSSYF